MSVSTIEERDRIEIRAILSLVIGVVARASYFLGLLSIFGQAAQIFRLFDLFVGFYRKIFYWLYSFVLPRHLADYKKDLITVAIFSLVIAIQYAVVTYLDLARRRAAANGEVESARQLAREKREAANASGGVVSGAIIGGIILGPVGALIGAAIGGVIDSQSSDEAESAEAVARSVEIRTRLQFDLALRAAALGLIRILAFSLALGGVFFLAGRYSAPIEHWLTLYDDWMRDLYEQGLRWARHLLRR
ncbi:MAG: hypothetical protein JSR60_15120 [Proteobacteria bacterium]|nr:hypothetical protein [Pseudomonadota bacterium]